jgi:hypothetical protein
MSQVGEHSTAEPIAEELVALAVNRRRVILDVTAVALGGAMLLAKSEAALTDLVTTALVAGTLALVVFLIAVAAMVVGKVV